MPFGSELALLSPGRLRALYYRVYGAPRIGEKIRALHVLPQLESLIGPDAHLLDAGCGMGLYSLRVAGTFPRVTITAVDADPARIGALSALVRTLGLTNLSTRTCRLEDLGLEREFDGAVCVDVLEHIEQDGAAAGSLARCLKPGGFLVVHVPRRDQRHFWGKERDYRTLGHVRPGYTPGELTGLLAKAGLVVRSCKGTFGLVGTLSADLDESLRSFKPLWIAVAPLLLALARVDGFISTRGGNGVLMVAQKPG